MKLIVFTNRFTPAVKLALLEFQHCQHPEVHSWYPGPGLSLPRDISGLRSSTGQKLYFELGRHLRTLCEHFSAELGDPVLQDILRSYSPTWAAPVALARFMHEARVWVAVTLLASREDTSPIVLLDANPFGPWVADRLREIYPKVSFAATSGPLTFLERSVLLWLKAFQRRKPRVLASGPTVSSPRVGVQFCMGPYYTRTRSDLYWWPRSQLSPERVLVYGDRLDTTVSPEAKAFIRRIGWGYISFRKAQKLLFALRGAMAVAAFGPLLATLPTPDSAGPRWDFARWLWLLLIRRVPPTLGWYGLYRYSRVRLNVNLSGWDAVDYHAAQSTALEWLGGVNFRTDSSAMLHEASEIAMTPPAFDVLFASGPALVSTFRRHDPTGTSAIVTSGYPFDYVFASSVDRARQRRETLIRQGVSHIVALFDEASGGVAYVSPEDVKAVYTLFFEWLLEEPCLGFVLKPKVPVDDVVAPDLLQRVMATGRCVVLLKDTEGAPVSPAEAALSADLAVGFPSLNSAAVEAALAGVPTLQVDFSGRDLGVYEGRPNLCIRELSRLKPAMLAWLRAEQSADFGDHKPILGLMDPFQDGKAHQRIGTFKTSVAQGLSAGLSPQEAVRHSCEEYAALYGADKVYIPPRFFTRS